LLSRQFRPFARLLSTTSSLNAELEVQEASSHVYHVKLNRPDRRNTFTLELWKSVSFRDMKATFDKLADDPKCRAIVISGNGKSFCAGIDLQHGMGVRSCYSVLFVVWNIILMPFLFKELVGMMMNDEIDVGRKGRMLRRIITTCQDGYTAIETCPKPVIAAVHSHCIGAGVDLITACDIRYASSDAVFNIKEVDIGMAADVGTLNRIQKIVGNDSWTREIAFTSRDVCADEALKFGLISRVFNSEKEVVEEALHLARTIAEKSPIAVQCTKEVLNHARNHTILESLDFVKTWNMSQLQSADLRNGAMAAMAKQKPVYEDV
ncbi:enoyl-CoA hydratase/isomerase family protein, partial [Ancylostoma ceylanicum]